MKTVRAKLKCESIEETDSRKDVKFISVAGTQGENRDFNANVGNLEIRITLDAPAYDFFKPGKQYYLDFTES